LIGSGDILIIAEGAQVSGIADRLGPGSYVQCGDPYDALLKMSRKRWRVVVLASPRSGLAGLCRACRRLQKTAKLFAVCMPSDEPSVRPLAGQVVDDYFILPPSDSDIRKIRGDEIEATDQLAKPVKQTDESFILSPGDFAALVSASQSVADLEAHLAGLIRSRCGAEVRWVAPDKAPTGLRPLLLTTGNVPRLLVPGDGGFPEDENPQRLLATLQSCLPALLANARRVEELNRLAITDYLTGSYNRRYFYQITDQILGRSRTSNFRAALLLFDIDNFKRYNDTYGHAAGDEILREVTNLMRQTTRAQDVVARIGGDEFVVLFWDNAAPRQLGSTMPATAQMMAERFRKTLMRHEFPSLGPEARGVLTISGGLATFPEGGSNCRQLLRSADGALRQAKQSGKNAIHLTGS